MIDLETRREIMSLAKDIAREAGRIVRHEARKGVEVAGTKTSPTDVVTETDKLSEEIIRRRILEVRPDDSILGEEGHATTEGSSGVRWIVDPIDGTVNYLYGIAIFNISIAVQYEGETFVGVVYNPMSKEMFSAIRGGGARIDGFLIDSSGPSDLSKALVGTGFSYKQDLREKQAAEMARLMPRVRDIRRMGSAAIDLSFVAAGRLDAHVERGLQPWDLAAGQLIAEEAGMRVEGLNGEAPGVNLTIAAAPELFDTLHAALLECGFDSWRMPEE